MNNKILDEIAKEYLGELAEAIEKEVNVTILRKSSNGSYFESLVLYHQGIKFSTIWFDDLEFKLKMYLRPPGYQREHFSWDLSNPNSNLEEFILQKLKESLFLAP